MNQEILARAIGRRKEAVAQVQFIPGNGEIIINGKSAQDYLHHNSCSILAIKAPFEILQSLENSLKLVWSLNKYTAYLPTFVIAESIPP